MRTVYVFLVCLLLALTPLPVTAEAPTPAAKNWLLVDVASGRELAGGEATARIFPASTTKVLTALVLLEHAEPDELVTVGAEVKLIGRDSSVANLAEGDILTVYDLLMALMLPSGNDAAYTAAVFTARKAAADPQLELELAVASFAELMNQTARNLGAENSNFVTPDGYHHPEHYSTARDMSRISLAALKNPLIRRSASTYEYTTLVTTAKGEETKSWLNTNLLLRYDSPYYHSDTIGLKTGSTPEAGSCLVSLARRDEREVLALVFGSSRGGRWQDSILLLEHYFSEYHIRPLINKGQPVTSWGPLEIAPGRSLEGLLNQSEQDRLELKFIPDPLLKGSDGPLAPIAPGQIVGELQWLVDGQVVASVPALAVNRLAREPIVPISVYFVAITMVILALFTLFRARGRKSRTVSGRNEYYKILR